MTDIKYEIVIGLEVHLQLATKTKAFCGCSTLFGQRPNSQTCPVCLGFPGSLPKLNEDAFKYSLKVAKALGCEIQKWVKFDRKNYYYPDLPKNFQISQYDKPIAFNGSVVITSSGTAKTIHIKRVHLEEDAGKLIHDTPGDYSFVDYNRAGMPLLEIVTEPDLSSPDEAYEYLSRLKAILKYLDVSDCDMEKGSLRCDANISIRPVGEKGLGSKVELKNMNSFKNVKEALEYEAERQIEAAGMGERIRQETRLWDAEKSITCSMRSKEEAHDYRYFPEPDLVPFVDTGMADSIEVPELPDAKAERFMKEFSLSEYDANLLTAEKAVADYFESALKLYDKPKILANWISGDIAAKLNEKNIGIKDLKVSPEDLVNLLKMIDSGKISGKMAKDVLSEMVEAGAKPDDIVKAKGLSQITDASLIEEAVKAVLKREAKSVADYKGGKKNAFTFLVGQVMKDTKGKASPAIANEILKKLLGD